MSAVAHIREYKTGRYFSEEFRGTMSWNGSEHNVLLRNEGTTSAGVPRFTDVAMAVGADDIRDARGVAVADYDNDGDVDIAVNPNPGDSGRPELARAVLLRNHLGEGSSWVAVELIGDRSNRDGVGARVSVRSNDDRQMRLVSAGSGYASQHSRRLYFGLGDADTVDELTVRWPSGTTDRATDLPARALVRLHEGGRFEVASLPGSATGPRDGDSAAGASP